MTVVADGPYSGYCPRDISGMWMRESATKVIGDLAVAPLRVVVLPFGQVVFGPSQRGPVPGRIRLGGVRTGFGENSHRRQGSRTDGVMKRGPVRIQVGARSADVRTRPDHPS